MNERQSLRPVRARGGPIPLHRYRKSGKSARETRANAVAALAETITFRGRPSADAKSRIMPPTSFPQVRRFDDPDPWGEGPPEQPGGAAGDLEPAGPAAWRVGRGRLTYIVELRGRTLGKAEIGTAIRDRFRKRP